MFITSRSPCRCVDALMRRSIVASTLEVGMFNHVGPDLVLASTRVAILSGISRAWYVPQSASQT